MPRLRSSEQRPKTRPPPLSGALHPSEEQFKLLVDAVKDYAIFMLDPDGKVVTWNEGAALIKGYTAAEIIGRSFERFYPADEVRAGKPQRGLEEARRTGHFTDTGERVRKDGTRFWADVVITALYDDAGALRGYAKVTRDVSARKANEEALREAYESLEQRVHQRTAQLSEANLEMEAFNYTVSHDLRAPLRAIRGFAEVLLEDYSEPLGEEGREYCRRLSVAGARMEQLVEDLLAYGRLSRQELSVRDVALDSVVAEVLQDNAQALRASGAKVTVDTPLPSVKGHRPLLLQVLQNLIGNSVKFVAPGKPPAVHIRGERRGARSRLYVEDRGIGIALEHRDRIFRVFERLHSDEQYPGTGIGLAIVRRAIERQGGTVGMEPRTGGGSCFWIELASA
jgi:PAS domain S-box-containing protein